MLLIIDPQVANSVNLLLVRDNFPPFSEYPKIEFISNHIFLNSHPSISISGITFESFLI